jgi:protein associated with RNAse G/E
MDQHMTWTKGTHIVYREVWHGRVWTAMPMTVVQDMPELIVLYFHAGTRWKLPEGSNFLPLLQHRDWHLRDVINSTESVYFIPPGEAYAIRSMGGLGAHALTGWYVNFQEPVRRTPLGLDYMDQALDLVITPDLSEWQWKDMDELQKAQEFGIFSGQIVHQIRQTGQQVVKYLQEQGFSWLKDWATWRPPEEWLIPTLPTGWDTSDASYSTDKWSLGGELPGYG